MKLTVSTPSGLHIEYEPSNSLRGPDGVKLTVSTPSGLHIEFEGSGMDLPRLDDFLLQIARIELQRVKLPAVQQPDGGDHRPDPPAAGTAGESSRPLARTSPRAGGTGRPAHSRDAVIGAQARAAMSAQLAERHGAHHAQALALVAEHGPVSPAWVADQLVKNRRDTIALMRDMAAAGELVETDEGGYYDIPDRDDQEQAVAA